MRNTLSLLTTAALTLGLATAASAEINPAELDGTVTAFDGHYDLHVRSADGALHDVHLHPGTQILPTGITLAPGMKVAIRGAEAVDAFSAAAVATNYHRIPDRYSVTFSNLGWAGIAFPTDVATQSGAEFEQDGR